MAFLARVFDFLCSLRLAVIIILALGVLSAVGTIYEARYDTQVAQKLIYKSIYMYIVMGALVINLTAVMIDRWPWKRHHMAFVLAHIGIIVLLAGSVITQKLGIDGTMAFGMGESNRYVRVDSTELAVFASIDGTKLIPIHQEAVDFFMDPPGGKDYVVKLGEETIEVVDYFHYGLRKTEIVPSDKEGDGSAIRIQLQSPRVNLTQWFLGEPGTKETTLGPARVVVTTEKFEYKEGNVLVLLPGRPTWKYEIYTASKGGLTSSGKLSEGDTVPTGWMDIELRVIRMLEKAAEKVSYERRERPTSITHPAIKIRRDGEEYWLALNSVLKFFTKDSMYWVSYANRRIDLGFPLTLVKFNVGRYQGTMRAATYESQVMVPGKGEVVISMNEPLKHAGFTFYQASFEQDEMGKPTASILSVNYDPGRWIKYLGSALIVWGSIMLFYFRRKPRQAAEAK